MNKTQLVDALAARTGDRRAAATAVDHLLSIIVETVGAGESVTLTGFGVFESRARAARVARNPRTGATVQVAATTVPAFRPGAGFRSSVGGGPAVSTVSAPVTDSVAVEAPAKPAKAKRAKPGKATAKKAADKPAPAPAKAPATAKAAKKAKK